MSLRLGALFGVVVALGACGGGLMPWPGRDTGRGGATATGSGGAGGITFTGTGGNAGSAESGGRGGSIGIVGTGGGAAGAGVAGASGSAGNASEPCAPKVLLEGTQKLIDFFVVDEGVIVVRSDGIVLVNRQAQVTKTVPFAREITAAAFDGETLVVADPALITVLDRSLTIGPTALLTESCVSSVLVSGKRFVCGPMNDWDRIFYTYDVGVTPPVQIGVSAKYTYNGRPMRRVPGTDDFITVTTDLSPSDFHLYRVSASGQVVYINESPYHGDFAATMIFAFDTTPAAHLVQTAGLMLRIYGDGCDSTMNSFNTGCFTKDGALGTLRTGEYYVGLGDDGAGTMFAIVGSGGFSTSSPCQAGCAVQRIDVANRTIVSQKTHVFTSSSYSPNAVLTAGDPQCANVIVGVALPSTDPWAVAGYRVQSLDY